MRPHAKKEWNYKSKTSKDMLISIGKSIGSGENYITTYASGKEPPFCRDLWSSGTVDVSGLGIIEVAR